MKIIVISPPQTIGREMETLIELFHNGLEIFHLRKPGFSEQQTAAFVESIPKRFHGRVVLHHHHRLVGAYGLKGIHFTEEGRRSEFDRMGEIRKNRLGLNLSASFHRIADIMEQGGGFDYVFLSPVFDSISKKDNRAAFDLPDLQAFLKSAPTPVIALGGVDATGIETVRKLGFSGAAILGAVWEAKNPVASFLKVDQAAKAA